MFGLAATFIQSIAFTDYPHSTKQDGWIVALASSLIIIPFMFMYLRILKLNPEKNLFEILEYHFGKAGGRIATCLFVLYVVVICALTIRNFTEFVRIMVLPNTAILYVTIFFCILCLFLQKQGMAVLARYSLFAIPIAAIILLPAFILSMDIIDVKRLMPAMKQPVSLYVQDISVMSQLAFGQVFLLLALLPARKGDTGQSKAVWWAYAGASLFILSTIIRSILIIGGEAYSGFFFSIYASYSVLRIGNFVNRLEALISGCVVLMLVCRAGVLLQFLNVGTARLIKSADDKILSVPIVTVCAALSLILFHHTSDKEKLDLYLRFVSAFFLIAVPLILWIFSEIRKKRYTSINSGV